MPRSSQTMNIDTTPRMAFLLAAFAQLWIAVAVVWIALVIL